MSASPPPGLGTSAGSYPEHRVVLVRRGRVLEALTLGWNVVGIVVLAVAAVTAGSVALAGFGFDSLIEIGASTVVLWELAGSHRGRQRTGLRLIGAAFALLALYLGAQSVWALSTHHIAGTSATGITWTTATAVVMLALAYGKHRTGTALNNPVLTTEARVTVIDAILAVAVLAGLVLNAGFGWWWADPAAALLVVGYAGKEAAHLLCPSVHTEPGSV
ncbi:MAG: cation transporter [Actinomycetota bacterium]|nr:cation transporter [Actinomycetota bacterium]